MNLAQLRAFDAVARAGGFTAAARALGVSQPAVTAHVRALEERYGVALFARAGRGVRATGLGRDLAAITHRLFAAAEEAEERLQAARALTTGRLRVGADSPYHATAYLAAFRARHPGIAIELSIGNADSVLADVRSYETDLAVVARHDGDRRLLARPIGRHRLVLFCARTHPWAGRGSAHVRELERAPMVLRERGSATRALFEAACARFGTRPAPVMEIESREAVREAVAAGLGLGVVSEAELGHDGRLATLALEPGIETREWIVCPRTRARTRLVRAFLEVVEEVKARGPTVRVTTDTARPD